jgi:hypothetical protein
MSCASSGYATERPCDPWPRCGRPSRLGRAEPSSRVAEAASELSGSIVPSPKLVARGNAERFLGIAHGDQISRSPPGEWSSAQLREHVAAEQAQRAQGLLVREPVVGEDQVGDAVADAFGGLVDLARDGVRAAVVLGERAGARWLVPEARGPEDCAEDLLVRRRGPLCRGSARSRRCQRDPAAPERPAAVTTTASRRSLSTERQLYGQRAGRLECCLGCQQWQRAGI